MTKVPQSWFHTSRSRWPNAGSAWRCLRAVEEAADLYDDPCDPFGSVRDVPTPAFLEEVRNDG